MTLANCEALHLVFRAHLYVHPTPLNSIYWEMKRYRKVEARALSCWEIRANYDTCWLEQAVNDQFFACGSHDFVKASEHRPSVYSTLRL